MFTLEELQKNASEIEQAMRQAEANFNNLNGQLAVVKGMICRLAPGAEKIADGAGKVIDGVGDIADGVSDIVEEMMS